MVPVDVASGGSVEAAARAARYAAFEAVLGAGDVLILGHHADDQVETVVLNMLRGSERQDFKACRVTVSSGKQPWCGLF